MQLTAVSALADTVVTGESTDPPIAVRVEDALGNPVEGTPVRFLVVSGGGSLSPGVAVASQTGIAESVYRAATTPGEAAIRVDIPSASHVAPIDFSVRAEAADTVLLDLVSGDSQRAEVGSQLPLPFEIRAAVPGGTPAGGVEIVFRQMRGEDPVADGGGGDGAGALTNGLVPSDSYGLARTVFTLGPAAGGYRVDAFATGGVYSDTISFTGMALASLDSPVALDSAETGRLEAGTRGKVFGSGFSPVPADNEVRIEGIPATVVSASTTELVIDVPAFAGACLPQREVGVRVIAGGFASNGILLLLDPAEPRVDLEVGEALTLSGSPEVECVHFLPPEDEEAAGEREFQITIGNVSRVASKPLSMTVATRTPGDAAEFGPVASLEPPHFDVRLRAAALAQPSANMVIRSQALDHLAQSRIAPVSLERRQDGAPVRMPSIPVLGDTLEYFFALGQAMRATCTDTAKVIRGVVRAEGEHLILAEDMSAPPGGPSAEEWLALGEELNRTVAPTVASYFGSAADIDGNGAVVVLFTSEVNRLGNDEADTRGFFLPLDLAASGRGGDGGSDAASEACPASNEAEIIYAAVADPDGRVAEAVGKEQTLRNTLGMVAREIQHLTSAERRALRSPGGFAAVEELWLDEALSSVAEEAVGFASAGLAAGGNYTFSQLSGTPAAARSFDAYQRDNFFNLGLYLLGTAAAPTIAASGQGGVGALQMRGFGWFLLRWLADRTDGDERPFFRSIVGGGRNYARGIANIERVAGLEWDDLLADFSVALAADDAVDLELPRRFSVATWDFRDVFASLNQDADTRTLFPAPFPLRAHPLEVETRALEIDVASSSAQHFSLVSEPGAQAMSLSVRAADLPLGETSKPQITIVRTR